MTSSSFNPVDLPEGPRPPELIDDPLEVAFDENKALIGGAIAEMERLAELTEQDQRGLRRA